MTEVAGQNSVSKREPTVRLLQAGEILAKMPLAF